MHRPVTCCIFKGRDAQLEPVTPEHEDLKTAERITMIVYVLHAISIFTGGVASIVAVVINYIKKEDVAATWLASHFRWQIRTFWYSLLWSILGVLLVVFLIGYVLLFVNFIWFIYRVIKGWLRLAESKSMYV